MGAAGPWLLPAAVLVLGWLASGWFYQAARRTVDREDREHFQNLIDDAQNELTKRLTALEDSLRGGAALVAASEEITHAEWKRYVDVLRLRARYPGMSGYGFAVPVRATGLEAFVAAARADEGPGFGVWDVHDAIRPPDGVDGRVHYIVRHVEMLDGSNPAIGLDLASEQNRRDAADDARDRGAAAMTRRIIRSTDPQRRPGFLLFVPVYRETGKLATVTERRAAFLGWIFAPFLTENFLDGALGGTSRELDMHFFEGRSLDPVDLLYDTSHTQRRPPRFEHTTELELAGQVFTLGWSRKPAFISREAATPAWIASALALIAVMLAGLVHALQSVGRRASALAEQRTAQLAAAQQELEAVNRLQRAVLDGTVFAVISTTPDGTIATFNTGAEKMLGIARADVVGRVTPLRFHVPEELASRAQQLSTELGRPVADGFEAVVALTRDGRVDERVWTFVHETGRRVPVLLSVTALRDAAGVITGFLGIAQDITARLQLEEELKSACELALQASRLKSEFLANMSHEIRTPMNGIIGLSGLLLDTPLNEGQRDMAQLLQRSAESLLTILNDILDFSKMEAGKLAIATAAFDLRGLVEDTVALLAPRAHAKRLELLCAIEHGRPWQVRGDAVRIRQVLTNLVGNAIKFTERGEVVVRVTSRTTESDRVAVRFSVRDTGPGIPAAAQAGLFQPFVQGDGTHSRRHGGTGLGLAIARQLAELMGGTIRLRSTPGVGSEFWCDLEFAPDGSATSPESPKPITNAAARKVLIVDDNATAREFLIAQLGELGVRAEAVGGGAAALERFALDSPTGGEFGLVLIDAEMPQMRGVELAAALRSSPGLRGLPLALLSSADPSEPIVTTSVMKFVATLAKPVRLEQLRRVVARVLDGPGADEAGLPGGAPGRPLRLHVLVAEDNTVNQLVAARLLKRMGCTVALVQNGQEAIDALSRIKFDVVLLDCQMPLMDGYETARHIRSGRIDGIEVSIPLIALTAYAMAGDRDRCLEAGMNDYVPKPVREADLLAAFVRCGLAPTNS